jgi:hypothetical protein
MEERKSGEAVLFREIRRRINRRYNWETGMRLANFPYPLRLAFLHKWNSWRRGFSRKHYFTCINRAVAEAVPLGYQKLTIIEFGVAAGKGLLEIEAICEYLEKRHPIKFEIFGFDSGQGLPKPQDYRDTPWKWGEAWYEMDVNKLLGKLKRAKLILGEVGKTVPEFMTRSDTAPIGAVMFDLDYYSSTTAALQVFSDPAHEKCLPRVLCYVDDIGSIEDVGVLCAISEFNEQERRKFKVNQYWHYISDPFIQGWKLYEFHDFDHPDYTTLVRSENKL